MCSPDTAYKLVKPNPQRPCNFRLGTVNKHLALKTACKSPEDISYSQRKTQKWIEKNQVGTQRRRQVPPLLPLGCTYQPSTPYTYWPRHCCNGQKGTAGKRLPNRTNPLDRAVPRWSPLDSFDRPCMHNKTPPTAHPCYCHMYQPDRTDSWNPPSPTGS